MKSLTFDEQDGAGLYSVSVYHDADADHFVVSYDDGQNADGETAGDCVEAARLVLGLLFDIPLARVRVEFLDELALERPEPDDHTSQKEERRHPREP